MICHTKTHICWSENNAFSPILPVHQGPFPSSFFCWSTCLPSVPTLCVSVSPLVRWAQTHSDSHRMRQTVKLRGWLHIFDKLCVRHGANREENRQKLFEEAWKYPSTNPFMPECSPSVANYCDFSPNVPICHSRKLKLNSDWMKLIKVWVQGGTLYWSR